MALLCESSLKASLELRDPNTAERSFLHSSAKTEVDLTERCFPGLRDGGTSRPAEEVERSARAGA